MNTITAPAFSLIVVGDEILSGKRQDKHLSKLIELLSARGLILASAEYVGERLLQVMWCSQQVESVQHQMITRVNAPPPR